MATEKELTRQKLIKMSLLIRSEKDVWINMMFGSKVFTMKIASQTKKSSLRHQVRETNRLKIVLLSMAKTSYPKASNPISIVSDLSPTAHQALICKYIATFLTSLISFSKRKL
jgi:hypothetical protein